MYNEEEWVAESLTRVLNAPLRPDLRLEIIVVDDASQDESALRVEELQERHSQIQLIRHDRNRGKGAAVRTALKHATGDYCLIQDADLEYSPSDYPRLLEPLLAGVADCVYGSRFMTVGERRVLYFWHSAANGFVTTLCNIISGLNLTDMETCYKAFRTSLLKSIPLRSERFGFEPEITIKVAQRQARIYETPISYYGRTYEEGKKIGLKDAFQAVAVMIRYGLARDIYHEKGPEILDVLSNAPLFNKWMADTIRPYLGQCVIELGAGIGNLTVQLAAKRRRYISADIDEEHLARLRSRLQYRRNVEVCHCDLQRAADFERFKSSLDSVICLNVIEHVQDDAVALGNIRSVLATGGRALILVPEGMSVYGTLDKVLGHYRRYSEQELRSKLQQAGFRVEEIIHFNRISRPAWFVNGRILRRRSFSRLQIRLFDSMVWFWRRLDRHLPWRPTSLIAIARRED